MEVLIIAVLVCGARRAFDERNNVSLSTNIIRPLHELGAKVQTFECAESVQPLGIGEVCDVTSSFDQFSRMQNCYECAKHWAVLHHTVFTHFVRTRPDLYYYEPLQLSHFPLAHRCISARFRALRGHNITDDYFSWHFGTSECEANLCVGDCAPCFILDDQFGVMTSEVASVYFRTSDLSRTDFVNKTSCPHVTHWWPELVLTRVLVSFGICVHPLNFSFRISDRALPVPTGQRVGKFC